MIPEEKLSEFVKRVRDAAGSNLEAVILFGSAAAGNYRPGFSDLNLLCVLGDSSFTVLRALAPAAKWWQREKQPPPLCMTREELTRSTDVFTIELLDMVQHHRVLFGDDVLAGLHIPMHLHRIQVEYELREKLLLLRQHLVIAADSSSQLWDVLLHSAPSFATLFRHALIALGKQPASGRHEAVQELSTELNFDPSAMQQVLALRERKSDPKNTNVIELCTGYVAAIEKVASAVDKALEAKYHGVK
jgi:predicted nucleotidyltransferase